MEDEKVKYLLRYYLYLLPLKDKMTLRYPNLLDWERTKERVRIAGLIMEKHSDKVHWNNCPKCQTLARTPFAKQCRYCQHVWH